VPGTLAQGASNDNESRDVCLIGPAQVSPRSTRFSGWMQEKREPVFVVATALDKTFPLYRTMRKQIENLRWWAKVRVRLARGQSPEVVEMMHSSNIQMDTFFEAFGRPGSYAKDSSKQFT